MSTALIPQPSPAPKHNSAARREIPPPPTACVSNPLSAPTMCRRYSFVYACRGCRREYRVLAPGAMDPITGQRNTAGYTCASRISSLCERSILIQNLSRAQVHLEREKCNIAHRIPLERIQLHGWCSGLCAQRRQLCTRAKAPTPLACSVSADDANAAE